ncbi:MAG: DUF3775 domain-containing protein [Alphaproteobacteria bacterium]
MLQHVTAEQVKEIARLAREARAARDRMLSEVPGDELGQPKPARGVHNPAAALGFRPLSPKNPARAALERAVSGLSAEAAAELRALMWIGREEDYGANELGKAYAASMAAPEPVLASLLDRADLHDVLMKALYEIERG